MRGWKILGAAVVAIAIFAVMYASIRDTAPWQEAGAESGAGGLDELTIGLFDTHVIALEILGVLLTAAMIGALVIARPLGAAPDDANYAHPTPEEVEATAHVSDVATSHATDAPEPSAASESTATASGSDPPTSTPPPSGPDSPHRPAPPEAAP